MVLFLSIHILSDSLKLFFILCLSVSVYKEKNYIRKSVILLLFCGCCTTFSSDKIKYKSQFEKFTEKIWTK